ncbi:MAG: hypothetical protein R3Y29_08270 [bacterium]
MSSFEVGTECGGTVSMHDKVKEECIIALKVYDFCRQLWCNKIQLNLIINLLLE